MRPTFSFPISIALLTGGHLIAQEAKPGTAPAPAGDGFSSKIPLAKDLASQATREKAVQFIEIVKKGGWVMYPMAALSFTMVLLIIYYMLTIRQGNIVSDKFMNVADALIRKQDYLGLIAVCNRENEAIARITYKTLDFATKNPTASFEEVREVTEAEGSRQASILNQRITYLADVGSVAPLVGLLGTVTGMMPLLPRLERRDRRRAVSGRRRGVRGPYRHGGWVVDRDSRPDFPLHFPGQSADDDQRTGGCDDPLDGSSCRSVQAR